VYPWGVRTFWSATLGLNPRSNSHHVGMPSPRPPFMFSEFAGITSVSQSAGRATVGALMIAFHSSAGGAVIGAKPV